MRNIKKGLNMSRDNRIKRVVYSNFHALTHKDFRYFWMGQCVSLIGTWMQTIGQSWLVLSLTNSPFRLGILATMQFLPITMFSLFAGAIIDRFPKKKVLIFTQTVSMVLAGSLSFMVFTETVKYEYILGLAFLLGCVNSIDMPTRQAFMVEIAGKEDLMNAVALNSVTFNLARILGPSIGAIIMAWFGVGFCFLLNAVSYVAVLYGLFKIDAKAYVRSKTDNVNIFREIKEGLIYVKGSSTLSKTIAMVMVIGIFAFNYNVLVPSFTKQVLHQQEKTYGLLMSFLGLGSLIGALIVSANSKYGVKNKILFLSSLVIGAMLILNGLNNLFYVTAIILALTGMANIYFSTTANITLQLNTKDEFRGRIMSIYSFVFAGATPLGSLFTGFIADRYGVASAFIVSGVLIIILAFIINFFGEKLILTYLGGKNDNY